MLSEAEGNATDDHGPRAGSFQPKASAQGEREDGTVRPAGHKAEEGKVARIQNLYATVYAFNMFTITDGAIRVIVLLHANNLGFTPLEIAFMFSLYELAGVVTNLFGGIAATRFGLKATLFTSLVLQLIGLGLLMAVEPIFGDLEDPSFARRAQVTAYITVCQMWSGIAKDFMKISCKTVPKLVTKPGENDALFKLVAWVTGLKNTLKGVGHLLGAILLEFASYEIAVGCLIGVIVLIVPVPLMIMDSSIGKGSKKTATFNWAVFQKSFNVNVLSSARFFLFGARDVWFEIAGPIFLRSILLWPEFTVGLFMGGYIILYGNIQTFTSQLYKKVEPKDVAGEAEVARKRMCKGFDGPPTEKHVPGWAYATAVHLAVWGSALYPTYLELEERGPNSSYQWVVGGLLIGGLVIFAFLFAVNSAVHSYLIVLYSGKDKAAMDLGFYYMANAMGRLVGTLLSGAIYQYSQEQFGLSMCLWTAALFMTAAGLVARWLRPYEAESLGAV